MRPARSSRSATLVKPPLENARCRAYAPGAAAAVTIRYAPGSTVLTVANSSCPPAQGAAAAAGSAPGLLAGAGGGHGLATMRERAQRVGGTARSGPHDGGWLVEVDVPA